MSLLVSTRALSRGSELYGYRTVLAHMLPEEIGGDRVWFESLEAVARLRDALPLTPGLPTVGGQVR